MLSYVGLYLYDLLSDPVRTAVVVRDTVERTAPLQGVLVRDESVLKSGRAYCSVTAVHGRRVAAGEALGLAYDSEASLLRAERISSLTREISLAETVLSGVSGRSGTADRARDARSAVMALSTDVARHDLTSLSGDVLRVRALIFDGGADVTRSELDQMRTELSALRAEGESGTETLAAPASGVFTPLLDGYERLTPAVLTNLSAADLETLLNGDGAVDTRAYGKLVTSYDWFFAGLTDEASAASLTAGDTASLDLSGYRAGTPRVTVRSVSAASDGMCAVVFLCSQSLTDTLALRFADCNLILDSVSGLRVPAEAVRTDGGSQTFVYIVSGPTAARVDVQILCVQDEYALVAGEGLREGAEVLIGGKNLYDGKVL